MNGELFVNFSGLMDGRIYVGFNEKKFLNFIVKVVKVLVDEDFGVSYSSKVR